MALVKVILVGGPKDNEVVVYSTPLPKNLVFTEVGKIDWEADGNTHVPLKYHSYKKNGRTRIHL